jgi:hypothetical protein
MAEKKKIKRIFMVTNVVGDTEEISIMNPNQEIVEYLEKEGHLEDAPENSVLRMVSIIWNKAGTIFRLGFGSKKED